VNTDPDNIKTVKLLCKAPVIAGEALLEGVLAALGPRLVPILVDNTEDDVRIDGNLNIRTQIFLSPLVLPVGRVSDPDPHLRSLLIWICILIQIRSFVQKQKYFDKNKALVPDPEIFRILDPDPQIFQTLDPNLHEMDEDP